MSYGLTYANSSYLYNVSIVYRCIVQWQRIFYNSLIIIRSTIGVKDCRMEIHYTFQHRISVLPARLLHIYGMKRFSISNHQGKPSWLLTLTTHICSPNVYFRYFCSIKPRCHLLTCFTPITRNNS